MRTVAIHGGGDWYDASADYLIVSDDLNLKDAHDQYQLWLTNVYHPDQAIAYEHKNDFPRYQKLRFLTFSEYLKSFHGASDSDIEIFTEC